MQTAEMTLEFEINHYLQQYFTLFKKGVCARESKF